MSENILKKKYESTMYALRRTLHQGSLERDWLEDVEKYVHSLKALSMQNADYLIDQQAIKIEQLKTKIQCFKDELNSSNEIKKTLKNKLELSNGRLDDAKQLLESWQTQDPKHHYDEFDPDSLGCITRAFLEKLK
jgi:tRNA(Ile)-lysidine synthase TilS/MesJ